MKKMSDKYNIRRAESSDDGKRLNALFSKIFFPEPVGVLAETMFNHLPRMKKRYWFIAEEKATETIVSAFALIPWTWEMDGIKLKIAEMGIVGTLEKYRGQKIMHILNKEFDRTLDEENFDFAVIQGIPGFYHKFGYYYSIPLENHINISLDSIQAIKRTYSFRLAEKKDIPWLMQEDKIYRDSHFISVFRDKANWEYLLTHSLKTEYGSEYWIMEDTSKTCKFYCRIPGHGFGKGLIVSEISDNIDDDALDNLLMFCRQQAIKKEKPYIRLNLHNDSSTGKKAISMNAEKGKPYAWQIKIQNSFKLLKKLAPVFDKRMKKSKFDNFSGTIRLDFFDSQADMIWKNGNLESVEPGNNKECDNTFCINSDLFPALCLGHRSWQELQSIRPDIFPAPQYVMPDLVPSSDKTGLLMDILFPPCKSWVYEQY